MTKPKKPNGRPTIFTETLATKICQRIADGESIRGICSAAEMPGTTTVFRWIASGKCEGFREQYEASVQIRLETLGDALIELADAPIERNAAGAIDSAAVQMRRLQIETRRWILSKLLPRKYGDRMGLDHQGEGFNLTVVTGVPESFASLEQKRLKIG
jgi:hypothetical protein